MQKKALDSGESLDMVVCYAFAVAAKLGDDRTQAWAKSELNGYQTDIPEYRFIQSRLGAWSHSDQKWISVHVDNPDDMHTLCTACISMPLSEVVSLAGSEYDVIQLELDHYLYHELLSETQAPRQGLRPCQLVPKASFMGILGVVRARVLEWSLDLEKRGVMGVNFEFSREEKDAAAPVHIQVQSGGTLHQVVAHNSSYVAVANEHSSASVHKSS